MGCSDGERSSFDFSGTAPQKFVAVNGLSIQVLAGNFSALNCSVAEGVMNTGTVDDSGYFSSLCEHNSSKCPSCVNVWVDSEIATGPSCDFAGIALLAVVTRNGFFESCDSQQPE